MNELTDYRTCRICGADKSLLEFPKTGKVGDYHLRTCEECEKHRAKIRQREFRNRKRVSKELGVEVKDLSRIKTGVLKRTGYRGSQETYAKLYVEQDGYCKCCGRKEPHRDSKGERRRLILYYSNISGRITGLVCRSCSIGLQCFDDNLELLSKAVAFLSKAKPEDLQEARAHIEDEIEVEVLEEIEVDETEQTD